MPDLFGQALWPGVPWFEYCEYTCSHGITPGQAVLRTSPEAPDQIGEYGDLTMTDGANTLTLRGCKVVDAAYSATGSGQRLTIYIADRRWRWRFSRISGRYNVLAEQTKTFAHLSQPQNPTGNPDDLEPPPHGTEPVRPDTYKTAPDLAKLCLEAMGETGYDVSALDATATPSVNWDVTNAAAALQAVCDELGCRVVYDPVSDAVRICEQGEGADLPDGPLLEDAPSIKADPRPENIECFGGRTRHQQRFHLRAVGRDVDGAIVPLALLSYWPTDDASRKLVAPPVFPNLPSPAGYTAEEVRALAASCVYRCYRVAVRDEVTGSKLKVPPDAADPLKTLLQINLLPYRNVVNVDDSGRRSQLAAACYGKHTPPAGGFRVGDDVLEFYDETDKNTEVKVPFQIDARHQMIVFDRPVYALKSDGTADEADLWLETAAEIADEDTHQYRRHSKKLTPTQGQPGLTASIVHEDVRLEYTAEYDDAGEFTKVGDNKAEADYRADYYLDNELQRYLPTDAETRTYAGVVVSVPMDGAVAQITWSVGGGSNSNPSTRVSRNREHDRYVPPFEGRRRLEETNLAELRQDRQEDLKRRQSEEAPDPAEAGV